MKPSIDSILLFSFWIQTARHITATATLVREKLEHKIFNVVNKWGGSLSIDCWLDKTKRSTFFGVTAHFIQEQVDGFQLHDRILCTRDLHIDTKDGIYCRQKLIEYLRSYNLHTLTSKLVFVSDRGSNMVKALEPYESINCFAHMMNNVVNKMLTEVEKTVTAVKSLVKYFKVTGMNSALDETLKSYVKTRWNSVYYMIKSVISNWDDIVRILTSKKETHRLLNISPETLQVHIIILINYSFYSLFCVLILFCFLSGDMRFLGNI